MSKSESRGVVMWIAIFRRLYRRVLSQPHPLCRHYL